MNLERIFFIAVELQVELNSIKFFLETYSMRMHRIDAKRILDYKRYIKRFWISFIFIFCRNTHYLKK